MHTQGMLAAAASSWSHGEDEGLLDVLDVVEEAAMDRESTVRRKVGTEGCAAGSISAQDLPIDTLARLLHAL